MTSKQINELLYQLYNKETTSKEEKLALLEACGCVWNTKMNKVVDLGSFMNMLYEYMGVKYDVSVKTTKTKTTLTVSTFYNMG